MKAFLIATCLCLLTSAAQADMSQATWQSCKAKIPQQYWAQGAYLATLPGIVACYQIRRILGLK